MRLRRRQRDWHAAYAKALDRELEEVKTERIPPTEMIAALSILVGDVEDIDLRRRLIKAISAGYGWSRDAESFVVTVSDAWREVVSHAAESYRHYEPVAELSEYPRGKVIADLVEAAAALKVKTVFNGDTTPHASADEAFDAIIGDDEVLSSTGSLRTAFHVGALAYPVETQLLLHLRFLERRDRI